MDANGTKFHLFLRDTDWGWCTLDEEGRQPLSATWSASPPGPGWEEIDWSKDRNELSLHSRIYQFIPAPNDKSPTLENRRGAACDRYGNWYWIGPGSTEILVNSTGTGNTSHFWSAGDRAVCSRTPQPGEFGPAEPASGPRPQALSGLAITGDHFLVAGTVDPAGILIFDLYEGGPPRLLLWPETISFAPLDMAAAAEGGVWILDRDQRVWALDRHFNIMNLGGDMTILTDERNEEFQPIDGGVRRFAPKLTFPAAASLAATLPVKAEYAIAIESLPDGSLLILDRKNGPFSSVLWYAVRKVPQKGDTTVRELVFINEISLACLVNRVDVPFEPQPGKTITEFSLVAHDFVFVPEHTENGETISDRLYVAEKNGNQSFGFNISQENGKLNLEPLSDYLPMRLFGGKGLVAAGARAFYDFDNRWIPLVRQRRPRFPLESSLYTPLDERILDGNEPDCVWHRLMLDAVIPPETKVHVRSRAANDRNDLEFMEWNKEPDPYMRGDGCELPFAVKKESGAATWETLFQKAKGRYLQMKITLCGDGRTSPRIKAMRVYYPRFSYLDQYLPATYRENAESASFLGRFLANFEGAYTALEDRIAAVQVLFDARSCPDEALDWLAGWFGIVLDPSWDDARRRMFIRHAMDFFLHRGTIHGLRMALHLAFDTYADERIFDDPRSLTDGARRAEPFRIVETFRTRRTPGLVLGDTSELSGPRVVEQTARWRPEQGKDELRRRYAEFLDLKKELQKPLPVFPITKPENQDEADAWTRYSSEILGFVPSAELKDLKLWRDFLRRRYRRMSAFNDAYKTSWTTFDEIPLPAELPRDGRPLADWHQFEGVVLAMRRTAHSFRVLVPMPRTEAPYSAEHQRRSNLATRIINLEKPAHTVFDVKFYWSMLRVGAVRLGEDTVIDDLSSRGAGLTARMVLGSGHLGESYISSELPCRLPDRNRLGCWHVKAASAHA